MSFFTNIKNLVKLAIGRRLWLRADNSYKLEKHGSTSGGWHIVPDKLNKDSILYSFGLGDDISFDLSMIEKYKLTVHGFDPTPKSVEWLNNQNLPKNFHFHDFGVYSFDGFVNFCEPTNKENVSFRLLEGDNSDDSKDKLAVKRVVNIMHSLRHEHINILKMDIEGSEYKVIEDISETNIRPDQILVEFHHKFSNKNLENTKESIDLIIRMGYKIFFISEDQCDYGFIRIKE